MVDVRYVQGKCYSPASTAQTIPLASSLSERHLTISLFCTRRPWWAWEPRAESRSSTDQHRPKPSFFWTGSSRRVFHIWLCLFREHSLFYKQGCFCFQRIVDFTPYRSTDLRSFDLWTPQMWDSRCISLDSFYEAINYSMLLGISYDIRRVVDTVRSSSMCSLPQWCLDWSTYGTADIKQLFFSQASQSWWGATITLCLSLVSWASLLPVLDTYWLTLLERYAV